LHQFTVTEVLPDAMPGCDCANVWMSLAAAGHVEMFGFTQEVTPFEVELEEVPRTLAQRAACREASPTQCSENRATHSWRKPKQKAKNKLAHSANSRISDPDSPRCPCFLHHPARDLPAPHA
jgi:hypothetical protein